MTTSIRRTGIDSMITSIIIFNIDISLIWQEVYEHLHKTDGSRGTYLPKR